jgi:hypothetical protein
MSQENVEIVRANFEVFNAGYLDALREQYHPDVIVRATVDRGVATRAVATSAPRRLRAGRG